MALIDQLRQLRRSLDPYKPVPDLRLYIDSSTRPSHAVERRLLRDPADPSRVLFVGGRGTGKSTELRKLADLLAKSGTHVVETLDLDASGVLAKHVAAVDLMYLGGVAWLRRVKGAPRKALFKALREAYAGDAEASVLDDVAGAIEGATGFAGAVGAAAGDLGATALAAGAVGKAVATGVRLIPQDRFVSESSDQGKRIIDACVAIARQVRSERGDAPLCLLIDGLERMNGEANARFKAVFLDTGLLQRQPWSSVIAAPPSTLTQTHAAGVGGYSLEAVWGFPHEPDKLAELVERRFAGAELRRADYLDEGQVSRLVAASGGLPRHLAFLCRSLVDGLLDEVLDGQTPGARSEAQVDAAVRALAFDIQLGFNEGHYQCLDKVRETGRLPADGLAPALFANGAILADPPTDDDTITYRVHPVIAEDE